MSSKQPDATFMHPSQDPEFGKTVDEPVWYLAHPLTTDDEYTYNENMDHVLKVARTLIDNGIRVIVPWHTLCLCMNDNDPEHRRIGLEIDCYVAAKLGRIILSGHRTSGGMLRERQAVEAVEGYVADWTTIPDKQLPSACRELLYAMSRRVPRG